MMKTTDYGQNTVHTAEHYDATQQSSKSSNNYSINVFDELT